MSARPSLRHYAVYGECLASSIEFPELAPMAGTEPRWAFETTSRLAPMIDAVELGADRIYGEVFARLHSHSLGHRITVDDTGAFDLSADRRRVTWGEREGAWPDFVRAHLLGRVLATALFLDGLLPLHASAVATSGGVIAFLAPKGFGKSSLALALAAGGASLVTDDTLPVEAGEVPRAWPGVHSIRVREDSLDAAGVTDATLDTREGKRMLRPSESAAFTRPAPLAALYLLDPVVPTDALVSRQPMPAMLAAISIVAHVKIGRMLGPAAAGTMLERASRITRAVPVFRLHPPRDLTRLSATAAAILEWHGASTT